MLAEKLRSATASAPSGAWNLATAYYDPPVGLAWNITTISQVQQADITVNDATPNGIFFKPDGTKMYIVGAQNDRVNEYNLSNPWDISTIAFFQFFNIGSQDSGPQDIFFRSDGLKMYMLGSTQDRVNEYNLSIAWDISTLVFSQFFSVAAQENGPTGLFFRPDGTKMYIVGTTFDRVVEYNLSTAWNISTATFVQNFSVAAQTSAPVGVSFKSDGLSMYVLSEPKSVFEYTLSTAWNVSTASYLRGIELTSAVQPVTGFYMRPNGGAMYVVGELFVDPDFAEKVDNYVIGGFSVNAQESTPTGIFFRPDGTSMYIIGSGNDRVNQYNLSTAWDLSTASFFDFKSVSPPDTTAQGLFFKPDGLRMYFVGSGTDRVYEFELSTAWNITTATEIQSFSVAGQDIVPTDVFFKPDGLSMYVVGSTNDSVYEYSLSTAWNIGTAGFVRSISVSPQDLSPSGLFFKPDGTKMYVLGNTGDDVNEYDLSTAWNISTALYVRNFSVVAQEGGPSGLFFKSDGLKMYIVGTGEDMVLQYSLGT
jgi:DNA-binding beta-propeller fold protein YncE